MEHAFRIGRLVFILHIQSRLKLSFHIVDHLTLCSNLKLILNACNTFFIKMHKGKKLH